MNQQNAPDYIRTFYKPAEVPASDVIQGNEVGGYKPALQEGIHGGADVTPKPAVTVTKPTSKAPAMRVPRAPKVTKTGPEDSLVVLTIVIAVFMTLALSVRRSSMYSLPQ